MFSPLTDTTPENDLWEDRGLFLRNKITGELVLKNKEGALYGANQNYDFGRDFSADSPDVGPSIADVKTQDLSVFDRALTGWLTSAVQNGFRKPVYQIAATASRLSGQKEWAEMFDEGINISEEIQKKYIFGKNQSGGGGGEDLLDDIWSFGKSVVSRDEPSVQWNRLFEAMSNIPTVSLGLAAEYAVAMKTGTALLSGYNKIRPAIKVAQKVSANPQAKSIIGSLFGKSKELAKASTLYKSMSEGASLGFALRTGAQQEYDFTKEEIPQSTAIPATLAAMAASMYLEKKGNTWVHRFINPKTADPLLNKVRPKMWQDLAMESITEFTQGTTDAAIADLPLVYHKDKKLTPLSWVLQGAQEAALAPFGVMGTYAWTGVRNRASEGIRSSVKGGISLSSAKSAILTPAKYGYEDYKQINEKRANKAREALSELQKYLAGTSAEGDPVHDWQLIKAFEVAKKYGDIEEVNTIYNKLLSYYNNWHDMDEDERIRVGMSAQSTALGESQTEESPTDNTVQNIAVRSYDLFKALGTEKRDTVEFTQRSTDLINAIGDVLHFKGVVDVDELSEVERAHKLLHSDEIYPTLTRSQRALLKRNVSTIAEVSLPDGELKDSFNRTISETSERAAARVANLASQSEVMRRTGDAFTALSGQITAAYNSTDDPTPGIEIAVRDHARKMAGIGFGYSVPKSISGPIKQRMEQIQQDLHESSRRKRGLDSSDLWKMRLYSYLSSYLNEGDETPDIPEGTAEPEKVRAAIGDITNAANKSMNEYRQQLQTVRDMDMFAGSVLGDKDATPVEELMTIVSPEAARAMQSPTLRDNLTKFLTDKFGEQAAEGFNTRLDAAITAYTTGSVVPPSMTLPFTRATDLFATIGLGPDDVIAYMSGKATSSDILQKAVEATGAVDDIAAVEVLNKVRQVLNATTMSLPIDMRINGDKMIEEEDNWIKHGVKNAIEKIKISLGESGQIVPGIGENEWEPFDAQADRNKLELSQRAQAQILNEEFKQAQIRFWDGQAQAYLESQLREIDELRDAEKITPARMGRAILGTMMNSTHKLAMDIRIEMEKEEGRKLNAQEILKLEGEITEATSIMMMIVAEEVNAIYDDQQDPQAPPHNLDEIIRRIQQKMVLSGGATKRRYRMQSKDGGSSTMRSEAARDESSLLFNQFAREAPQEIVPYLQAAYNKIKLDEHVAGGLSDPRTAAVILDGLRQYFHTPIEKRGDSPIDKKVGDLLDVKLGTILPGGDHPDGYIGKLHDEAKRRVLIKKNKARRLMNLPRTLELTVDELIASAEEIVASLKSNKRSELGEIKELVDVDAVMRLVLEGNIARLSGDADAVVKEVQSEGKNKLLEDLDAEWAVALNKIETAELPVDLRPENNDYSNEDEQDRIILEQEYDQRIENWKLSRIDKISPEFERRRAEINEKYGDQGQLIQASLGQSSFGKAAQIYQTAVQIYHNERQGYGKSTSPEMTHEFTWKKELINPDWKNDVKALIAYTVAIDAQVAGARKDGTWRHNTPVVATMADGSTEMTTLLKALSEPTASVPVPKKDEWGVAIPGSEKVQQPIGFLYEKSGVPYPTTTASFMMRNTLARFATSSTRSMPNDMDVTSDSGTIMPVMTLMRSLRAKVFLQRIINFVNDRNQPPAIRDQGMDLLRSLAERSGGYNPKKVGAIRMEYKKWMENHRDLMRDMRQFSASAQTGQEKAALDFWYRVENDIAFVADNQNLGLFARTDTAFKEAIDIANNWDKAMGEAVRTAVKFFNVTSAAGTQTWYNINGRPMAEIIDGLTKKVLPGEDDASAQEEYTSTSTVVSKDGTKGEKQSNVKVTVQKKPKGSGAAAYENAVFEFAKMTEDEKAAFFYIREYMDSASRALDKSSTPASLILAMTKAGYTQEEMVLNLGLINAVGTAYSLNSDGTMKFGHSFAEALNNAVLTIAPPSSIKSVYPEIGDSSLYRGVNVRPGVVLARYNQLRMYAKPGVSKSLDEMINYINNQSIVVLTPQQKRIETEKELEETAKREGKPYTPEAYTASTTLFHEFIHGFIMTGGFRALVGEEAAKKIEEYIGPKTKSGKYELPSRGTWAKQSHRDTMNSEAEEIIQSLITTVLIGNTTPGLGPTTDKAVKLARRKILQSIARAGYVPVRSGKTMLQSFDPVAIDSTVDTSIHKIILGALSMRPADSDLLFNLTTDGRIIMPFLEVFGEVHNTSGINLVPLLAGNTGTLDAVMQVKKLRNAYAAVDSALNLEEKIPGSFANFMKSILSSDTDKVFMAQISGLGINDVQIDAESLSTLKEWVGSVPFNLPRAPMPMTLWSEQETKGSMTLAGLTQGPADSPQQPDSRTWSVAGDEVPRTDKPIALTKRQEGDLLVANTLVKAVGIPFQVSDIIEDIHRILITTMEPPLSARYQGHDTKTKAWISAFMKLNLADKFLRVIDPSIARAEKFFSNMGLTKEFFVTHTMNGVSDFVKKFVYDSVKTYSGSKWGGDIVEINEALAPILDSMDQLGISKKVWALLGAMRQLEIERGVKLGRITNNASLMKSMDGVSSAAARMTIMLAKMEYGEDLGVVGEHAARITKWIQATTIEPQYRAGMISKGERDTLLKTGEWYIPIVHAESFAREHPHLQKTYTDGVSASIKVLRTDTLGAEHPLQEMLSKAVAINYMTISTGLRSALLHGMAESVGHDKEKMLKMGMRVLVAESEEYAEEVVVDDPATLAQLNMHLEKTDKLPKGYAFDRATGKKIVHLEIGAPMSKANALRWIDDNSKKIGLDQTNTLNQNVYTAWDNGNPTYYLMEDGALMDAVDGIHPSNLIGPTSKVGKIIFNIFHKPAAMMARLITMSPQFIIGMFPKDVPTAFARSTHGMKPGDLLHGFLKSSVAVFPSIAKEFPGTFSDFVQREKGVASGASMFANITGSNLPITSVSPGAESLESLISHQIYRPLLGEKKTKRVLNAIKFDLAAGRRRYLAEKEASISNYSGMMKRIAGPTPEKIVRGYSKSLGTALNGAWQILGGAATAVDTAPRMAERLAIKRLKESGLNVQDIYTDYIDRNLTIDFSRRSQTLAYLNAFYTFAAPGFQDMGMFIRNIKDPTRALPFFLRGIMAYTIPALINYLRWRDDDEWQALKPWEKYNFMYLAKRTDAAGNETGFWRIPYGIGVAASFFKDPVIAMLDYASGRDPEAFSAMSFNAAQQSPMGIGVIPSENVTPMEAIASSLSPSATDPLVDVLLGKDMRMSQNKIDATTDLKGQPSPEMRGHEKVGALDVALSNIPPSSALNLTPRQTSYLVTRQFPGIAAIAYQIGNSLFTKVNKAVDPGTDIGSEYRGNIRLQHFAVSTPYGDKSRQVTHFGKILQKLEQRDSNYKHTLKKDPEAAMNLIIKYPELRSKTYELFVDFQKDIYALRKERDAWVSGQIKDGHSKDVVYAEATQRWDIPMTIKAGMALRYYYMATGQVEE